MDKENKDFEKAEMDFDLNKPNNIYYYCFGCLFLKKDGSIDYNRLGADIEVFSEWIARIQFDLGDISNCAVYIPKNTKDGKWILECQDYEFTRTDFENLKKQEFFIKFLKVLPERIQNAFAALSLLDEKELMNVGIKKDEIEKISNLSLKTITLVKGASRNPKMA